MQVVASDGMDIEPVNQERLLIGNGETYDVIVSIPLGEKHEVRATAQTEPAMPQSFWVREHQSLPNKSPSRIYTGWSGCWPA